MFAQLLRRLSAPAPPAARPDSALALAALLVRLARADGVYAPEEAAQIDRMLARQFALSPFAATALRAQAEAFEAAAADTVQFTRALKEAVPLEDRAALMQVMWSVVLADGARGAEEEQLMRMVSSLLGLTDRDSALARQRVAGGGA
ncbi:MAG: TerB family tellurite resistance protein [Gemmobacter sp.]